MRSKKVLLNAASGFVGQALLIIVNLISRRYFLQILGEEYLGLNSLFANVLTLLSMAELGVGSAITYSLYKPLSIRDETTLKAIMKLFQSIYWVIGFLIIAMGLALSPFLGAIVNEGEGIDHLTIIYLIFLFNTAISYFFSYKSALIIADQNQVYFNINHYLWQFSMYVAQIILLVLTKNYFIYLICQIAVTVLENISISYIVNKKYLFVRKLWKHKEKVNKGVVDEIKKNTAGMVLSKIGSTLVNSTDNILISSFIGVGIVGIYGNYYTISAAVGNVLYQLMNATVASIGNISVDSNAEKKKDVFDLMYFVMMWLYGFSSICLFNLLTPFISLWYGEEYEIDMKIVLLIVINAYITGQSVLLANYISAMGLFWQNRFVGIIEAVLNLSISLLLVNKIGLAGIIFGTIISHVCWSIPIQLKYVFKNGIDEKIPVYFVKFLRDTVLTIGIGWGLFKIVEWISHSGVIGFVFKFIACITIPNILYFIVYHRTEQFKTIKAIFVNLLRLRK